EAVRLMALKPRCMMGVGHQVRVEPGSQNEEEYDFGYDDEPSPSPQGYCRTPNPQTPGYLEVPSPQLNPQYNTQTPGTPAMYNTEQYSPYTAPSPQGSYQPSPSPQSYHQLAPSAVGYQNTHSPASYHPTPSPMAISNELEETIKITKQGSSDWVTTNILFRVKDSFMHLTGQTGVVRSVTKEAALGLFSLFSISSDHLEPVTPTKNNKVSGRSLQLTLQMWKLQLVMVVPSLLSATS
ncbi:Transcription elongation factor SPT5 DRB sensitivity-inducing factor large subunit, partial [Takifugu flavidus]